jgi:hypothetical protein
MLSVLDYMLLCYSHIYIFCKDETFVRLLSYIMVELIHTDVIVIT